LIDLRQAVGVQGEVTGLRLPASHEWGVPVMPGPLDPAAAGHEPFRASHADREQVIELLKAAFVQGRLDKDELDALAGQALASRTYAELAALTADIPAGPAAAPLRRRPARAPRSRIARDVAIGSGIGLSLAAAIVLGGLLNAVALLGLLALPIGVVALFLIVASALSPERRSRGQLPPRPGAGGPAPEVQPPGQVGRDPDLPRDRPDQDRSDLQIHRSRPGRRHHFGLGARAAYSES
jgi:DUF1707 SHOCT-like domain